MHNHHRKSSPLALGNIASGVAKATVASSCLLTATAAVAETVLEEIIVNATKRGATSLMDTPISVNVVTGDELKFREIRGAEDLRTSVSGVYIDEGGSTPKLSIRGVGFDNTNIQAENGVTTYVDGVILQRTQAILLGFLDLGQVEVLKGPQGSAFGRNATGGSINLITAKPEDGTSGEIYAGFGSFDRRNGGVVFNHGGDTFGVRFAASHERDDGYITNLVTGNDEIGAVDNTLARLSLSWDPSDTVSVDYALHYADQEILGPGITYSSEDAAARAGQFVAGLMLAGLALANPDAPFTNALNDDFTVVNRLDPETKRESILHTLTVEFDLGWATLKSITGYMDFETDWLSDVPAPGNLAAGLGGMRFSFAESEQFSQEFLLTGSTDRFNWVTGVYYLEEEAEDFDFIDFNLAGPGTALFNPGNNQTLESFAVFADGQFSLTDRLRLNAGVRWTDDEKVAEGQTRDTLLADGALGGAPDGEPDIIPGSPFTSEDQVSKSTVTWQTGLEFDLSDELFTYVRLAKGFKAGGINSHNAAGPTFYDPEELLSLEAGLKGNVTDNLTFSISAFTSDYQDIQLFVNVPGSVSADIINAAEATITGIDVDLTWNATDALSFDAKVTWLSEAEYDSFETTLDGVTTLDLSGEALNRSPDFTGIFGVNYNVALNDRVELNARAEVYATSEVHFSFLYPFVDGDLTQDSYELYNFFLGATIDDAVDVRVYGKNITDEFYQAFGFQGVAGNAYGSSGRPEEYGIEVRYRF